MPQLDIYLNNEDMDRLFVIKALAGRYDQTGNQFATDLLTQQLHQLFPEPPRYDEDGQLINGDCYTG